jgi:hypothetical protein
MFCLRTKFQTPISNGSLVITTKPQSKYRIRAAAILFLSYILQKNIHWQNCIFSEDLLSFIISSH